MEHFAYPLPFNSELREFDLIPYRANHKLTNKINYIFSHPHNKYRDIYIHASNNGSKQLTEDMARVAIGCTRYFILNKQQFAHKMDNIHLQLLVRMWKQTFKHTKLQNIELDKYYSVKLKLLSIDNGLIEELIRTIEQKDYIQHSDDMVKKRKGKELRQSNRAGMVEGSKSFEYLCSLE